MNRLIRRVPYARGNWKVTRFCCREGMCFRCRDAGTHGNKEGRARIVHTHGVSQAWAELVADNWTRDGFGAKAEEMKEPPSA